jgi:hypothetical protein
MRGKTRWTDGGVELVRLEADQSDEDRHARVKSERDLHD